MPQLISCPDCGRKLRVPDALLGKRVKCPGCGGKFVGEADAPPEELEEAPVRSASVTNRADSGGGRRVSRRPAEEDEDLPPPSRRGYDDEREDEDHHRSAPKGDSVKGWQRVRLGINLNLLAVFLFVGGFVVFVIGMIALVGFGVTSFANIGNSLSTGPPSQSQAGQVSGQAAGTLAAVAIGSIVVYGLFGLLNLLESASRVAGEGFCMGVVPPRRATYLKGLAITTFAIGAASVLFFYGGCCAGPGLTWAAVASGSRFNGIGLEYPSVGLAVTLFVAERYCWLFFLRGTAVAMRHDALARQIVYYAIAVPVIAVIFVVLWFVLVCGGAMLFVSAGSQAAGAKTQGQTNAALGNFAGMGMGLFVAFMVYFSIVAITSLCLFVWYIILLFQTRGAVSGYLHDR